MTRDEAECHSATMSSLTTQRVGILGGGQLGRMMASEAQRLSIPCVILDKDPQAPAKQLLAFQEHVHLCYTDKEGVKALAQQAPIVITVEIEHVNCEALEEVSQLDNVTVEPAPHTISTIQDKYRQKEHLRFHGVPVVDFGLLETPEMLENLVQEFGFPIVLKKKRWSYDGKGNFVAHDHQQLLQGYDELGPDVYAERYANFKKELAVMVVKGKDTVKSYPVVETVHKNNVCFLVEAPADIDCEIRKEAHRIAELTAQSFTGCGIFGVEMFLLAGILCG